MRAAAAAALALRRELERWLRRTWNRARPHKVGWVTAHTLTREGRAERIGSLGSFLDMRLSRNAGWINARTSDVWNEIYDPAQRYDVVVFVKAMDLPCMMEARRIKAYGGRVVFDANVNYYELWGEYDVEGTRPTTEQQQAAIEMTQLADWVVADSSYLLGVIRKRTDRATWIPDNVDLAIFKGVRSHRATSPVRLVWSGVSHKAKQLLSIRAALAGLPGVELVLVSERLPPAFGELQSLLPCRFVPYSDARYARLLLGCDVIISPKRLVNGYELGHSEYKITLGMAVGLPAIASPQPSYVEAISHAGGGMIVSTDAEWREAVERLAASPELRAELGARAHRTVVERYSTDVVAPHYERVLRRLL